MNSSQGESSSSSQSRPQGQQGEVLHGGAVRLGTRVVVGDAPAGQRVSWYEIAPGSSCTLHVHQGKTETWLILAGRGRASVGEEEFVLEEGDMIITEAGTPHGLVNTEDFPLRFVNIAIEDGLGPLKTTELESI